MVWEPVLDLFENEINKKGFFHWDRSFQDFKSEFNVDAQQKAPFYLSLDFYRQQRPELTNRGWYVIRLGQGNFGIFDSNRFPKPYLDLSKERANYIRIEPVHSHRHMRKAFKSLDYSLKSAENSLLELARFYNIFETMVRHVDGSQDYKVGPRGLMTQKFNLYFKKSDDGFERFLYDGQVELDYSIWTENRVFVIEAKSRTLSGYDIGWHKMAYPSRRFVKQVVEEGLKVNPVYFLRTRIEGNHVILLYVFTEMEFEDEGIVLNDERRWNLLNVFRVDIDQIDAELR